MIWVIEQTGAIVEKYSLRFLEGHTMFLKVGLGLTPIPGKFDIAHSIILAIRGHRSSRVSLPDTIVADRPSVGT
jgi:hypothetical protein